MIRWIIAVAALAQNLVAPPTDGWPKSGGNLFNQNYSPLTQINRQNIAGLKAVWRARLHGSGAGAEYFREAQPIVPRGGGFLLSRGDEFFGSTRENGHVRLED